MPYIEQKDRDKFIQRVEKLSELVNTDGELNYCITLLVHKILNKRGLKYQNMNNLVGCLECAKQEFLRTVVGPYEDKKIIENGHVSELDR
jgi:hypothetical protein